MRLLPELQGSRGDCQGPAAALSRLHVVSLVRVRILYRSVYRQGAPSLLPSLPGAGCRCWTLPRAHPAELPIPGCSHALIALVPPFPARAGTAHPPCLLSLTPNPSGAAHSLSPLHLPARASWSRGPCCIYVPPRHNKIRLFSTPRRPGRASFAPPAACAPRARTRPAPGPAPPVVAAAAAGPRSGRRRRDDDDGAEQDLRAEARQVPAGGGRRVLHDRLRGAARAGPGPGPGCGGTGTGPG